MRILTISGKARHGKDTAANLIREYLLHHGYDAYIYHYADPVKMCATNYFGWDGNKDEAGRTLLQHIGTERARAKCENTWTDLAKQIIERVLYDADFVIIPDCRFPNEIECWNGEAISIHVERIGFESELTDEQKKHASETALDDYFFNYKIKAATLEDLENSIDVVMSDILMEDYLI